ncbi:5'-3' exonuclease H3TH domain-containing protein [Thermosipho sp. (in: thermotogales)]|jgi:DNA polymerase-1|uniref:5'-3' exonuclease n=1 Tax=Thermosipho sp. (in: thermotogales) TaxID=1968895 RepID=UPI00257C5CBB|nr:5'-3' exonuclease H3TH domain-containing protein [Thermosipho sp. (in: thermotogales)]MBZ4649257.1 polA [Thermosipho sp. (in: thermotogales)]
MYDTIIVDGNNLAYKSFFIHKNFSTEIDDKIVYTGVCYGFINSLIHLKKEYLNDKGRFYVAWDRNCEYRKSIYPEYKMNRQKNDEESKRELKNFLTQRAILQRLLIHLGIDQVYSKGWEADDVISTLANIKSKLGQNVLILSSDHDYYQLITENINLLSHKGGNNITLYDIKSFKKEFEIEPCQYYYVMCLTGCKGDNVPGVRGIGEKTALKLIRDNPDLIENILNDNILNKNLQGSKTVLEKVKNNIDIIKLASKLVKIYDNIEKLTYIRCKKDVEKIEYLFELLSFNSFLRPNVWKIIEEL